eukprot:gene26246-17345_t
MAAGSKCCPGRYVPLCVATFCSRYRFEEHKLGHKFDMPNYGPRRESSALIDKPPTFQPHAPFMAAASRVQVLSWKPRAFVYHNFLSHIEAAHILKTAGPQAIQRLSSHPTDHYTAGTTVLRVPQVKTPIQPTPSLSHAEAALILKTVSPQMKRSLVVGPNDTGVVDNIRTSAGTFIRRHSDPIIAAVEQRLAVWAQLPPSHQEDMQVLRYGPTNKYGPHVDGLGRVMSVLIYLAAPEEGGETAFPDSKGWLHQEMATAQGKMSDCAKGHVFYKPKIGDALMFYDETPDYTHEDLDSTHTGCPVIKGTKWNAVKWIHGDPFRQEDYNNAVKHQDPALPDPGECVDIHEKCHDWAKAGECEKNPDYMAGGWKSEGLGNCRLSCKACTVCAKGDGECRDQNRKDGGFITYDMNEFGPLTNMVKTMAREGTNV